MFLKKMFSLTFGAIIIFSLFFSFRKSLKQYYHRIIIISFFVLLQEKEEKKKERVKFLSTLNIKM